jgi:hypothetical protein
MKSLCDVTKKIVIVINGYATHKKFTFCTLRINYKGQNAKATNFFRFLAVLWVFTLERLFYC